MEKIYTVKEVADYFQCTVQSVHNWIGKGKLKYTTTPGGEKRILESEVKRIVLEGGKK
jgi:excisionase family DNA binding protein